MAAPGFSVIVALLLSIFFVEVSEDLLDHHQIFYTGNDPDDATACAADVDVQHPVSNAAPSSSMPGVHPAFAVAFYRVR